MRRPSNGGARRKRDTKGNGAPSKDRKTRGQAADHTRVHTCAHTLTFAAIQRDGPLRLCMAPAGTPPQGLRAGLHEMHDVHSADLGETAHETGIWGIGEKALVACEGTSLKIFQLAALLKF